MGARIAYVVKRHFLPASIDQALREFCKIRARAINEKSRFFKISSSNFLSQSQIGARAVRELAPIRATAHQ
jgi:hypothetical protein